MDYSKWHFYLVLFNSALSFAAIIFAWWNTREKVIRSRFAQQTKEIAEIKAKQTEDLAEIKTKLSNMPGHCTAHAGIIGRLDGHNDRLGQHKELLTALEGELKHLPKASDLEKIYERVNRVCTQISDLKADVGKISGAMPGITHMTEMMNEFLLNHGSKK